MADAFNPDLARSAVALILGGQEPPFEGRIRARMDEWGPRESHRSSHERWVTDEAEASGVAAGFDLPGEYALRGVDPLAVLGDGLIAPGAGRDRPHGRNYVASAPPWRQLVAGPHTRFNVRTCGLSRSSFSRLP